MKKKIGILTFHDSNNYGAILQCYALLSKLKNMGYDAQVINYVNKNRGFQNHSIIKKIKNIIWTRFAKPILVGNTRRIKTEKFKNKYLNVDHVLFGNPDEITINPPDYDLYIVGSDQVWNPMNNGNDSTYYLNFVPESKKRISYAASFGVAELTIKQKLHIKPFLEKFDLISVREENAVRILEDILNRKVNQVLDPVFLLSSSEWSSLNSSNVLDEPYILCYYMPGDRQVNQKINEISKYLRGIYGYKIVNLGKKEYHRLFDKNFMFDAGPLEFVNLISNANFVITNSYHGCVFSILMNKEFVIPVNNNIIPEKRLHSRITSLITKLKMEHVLIDVDRDIADFFNNKVIYTDTTKNLLADEIENSNKFLNLIEKI